jgi:adenosylcobinamide-phosphate synthase
MSNAVWVLLAALLLDLALGEPPAWLHPVVWMGRWIGVGERHAPKMRASIVYLYGAAVVLAGLLVVMLLAIGLGALVQALPPVVATLISAWLLKTTFALRALVSAARLVQKALDEGDLAEAQRRLARHLVSRDTARLDAGLVAAATIESVAENFGDGLVAPLLGYALFGLPGALAFRFVNTADSMLGYRDARREYLGKFAARLDDVLNVVPARLAAGLLLAGAVLLRADAANGWRTMWRDHVRTASPNAGWPMSAMAGALGVRLEKVGHYALGEGGAPAADAIARSLRVMCAATVMLVIGLAAGMAVRP